MSLADEVATQFLIHDRKWKIGGELRNPSPQDIAEVLDRAREVLYGEENEDGATLFVGGLIVRREGSHLDVYLHLGDYNG